MTWVLRETVTTTYAVNIEGLDVLYGQMKNPHEDLADVLAMGGGATCAEAEEWLYEQWSLHRGSEYGDKLFYDRADQDTGLELVWEED